MGIDSAVERLAEFALDLTEWWPLAGGAVSLVDRDGTLATFGFGMSDAEHEEPASPHDVWLIGSISKTFVSLVVNQLVDEGVMALDEPITSVLPWVDLGAGEPEVELWQLLSHTGGLIMGADGLPDDLAQAWDLRNLARLARPIEHFHYSNVGYMLLGQAVEARTGDLLANEVRRRIFEPLGMTNSFGRTRQSMRGTMATGYWPAREDSPWAPGDPIIPAYWFDIDAAEGNVASSAADMAQFARLLLGDGVVDGVRVMSSDAMSRVTTATAPQGEDIVGLRDGFECADSRYGLGVNVEVIDGRTCLTHGGGMVGYQAFLLSDRDAGIGVQVLTNANGCYPVAQVIARAAHQLLVEPDRALPPARDAVRIEHAPALSYLVGSFTSDGPGGFTVEVSGDEPVELSLSFGGLSANLTRIWDGRYVTDHPALRSFRWDPADSGWINGPHVLTREAPAQPTLPKPEHVPLIGRYRSYSPWYPTLRIVERSGELFLITAGGVEAPEFDCLLVPVGPGTWRIGADEWLPERIVAGPEVDGEVIMVLRDGHAYTRLVD
ncbi:MAG: serine hydrolase domain-containing protein [Actinomycetes bacterium]